MPRGPGAGENAPAEAPLATRVHAFLDPDGVELPSSTPLFEYSVEVGQHVLTVRREGYQTVVDTVNISSGNVVRRSYVLIRN